jgi:hypothetical protein
MAKRGKSLNPGYKSGSHWANCFSCGFNFRKEDLKKTWDNRWVCNEDWEPRQPQDFLRTKKERVGVDEPILKDDTSVEINPTFGTVDPPPTPTF